MGRVKMMPRMMIMVLGILVMGIVPSALAGFPANTPYWQLPDTVNYPDESTRLTDAILKISALGRPLHPGTLYNALNDQLVPGINLWKTSDIQAHTRVSPKPETKVAVQASESLSEKTNLLNVEASVKAGFFSGLVEVGGSAKYLNKKTTSTLQSSLTFRHHETTQYKELLLTDLPPPDHSFLDKMDATHVVVGAMYGADAIMEFQQMASDQKDKEVIEGNLNIMIKKIPLIEINGDGSLNMTNEEKKKVEKFSCKFYGDLHLENLPSTFEEAVKMYKTLPGLLSNQTAKAVPLLVWLYPLSKLVTIESKLKVMIDDLVVANIGAVMDDLHQAKIRAKDLLEKSNGIMTKDISNKLENFLKSLNMFTSEFLVKLSKLIPGIREDVIKETALKELIKSLDASDFSEKRMKHWLDEKDTELRTISMYLKRIEDYKIIPPGVSLDTSLLKPKVWITFIFSFTSLDYKEQYLNRIMKSVMDFKSGSIRLQHEHDETQEVPWYRRSDVRKTLKHLVDVFNKNCYYDRVVSYISDPKYPIASILKYQDGVLVDSQFQAAKELPFYLRTCKFTLDLGRATPNLVLSEWNRRVTYMQKDKSNPQEGLHVMSREALDERCYWEVEWTGLPDVAVAYKSIGRHDYIEGDTKAWCLSVRSDGPVMVHGNVTSKLSVTLSDFGRVGVYLDRGAGTLSFYGVSTDDDTFTHLYTFNTTFTDEPLHAGFYVRSETSVSLV